MCFLTGEWNSLIDLYSYGHDIETAWLIDRGAKFWGCRDYGEVIEDYEGFGGECLS